MDASTGDDAAVLRLTENRALVLTTDFFTPIVDDPFAFGQIAAANALSDVYAMGGRPLWCLNLVGWPRDKLPLDMLGEVLRGAGEVVTRAGAAIVGGHSIDDPEPKFGLVVVGEVDPAAATTNSTAAPGDVLVLTKPIGTGIIATAIKKGVADEAVVREAIASMTALNAGASEAAREAGVRAATDVTGFGLLGHLRVMLKASGVAAEVWAGAVPLLEGARALAEAGHVPGGTRRNLESLAEWVDWAEGISPVTRILLADAQTSGGLLLSVPAGALTKLLEGLRSRGSIAASVIGRITAGEGRRVVVHDGAAPPFA